MKEKLKVVTKSSYHLLNDTRVLGLLAFGVVALLVSWSGVKSIQTNYELQKQISKLQQENDVRSLENQNQKLKNEYYKTDEFLELAARRQFGKAAPGETVLVVPKSVALSYAPELPKTAAKKNKTVSAVPTYQKNLQDWVNFYLHRPSQ